jgi:hypothetical protein
MKIQTSTKPSEPGKVNAYMKSLEHPLSNILEALRQIILKTDKSIGEEIKWNAPTFFYTGEMKPFNPKEYKRYLVISNLFKKIVFAWYFGVQETSRTLQACSRVTTQMAGGLLCFTT